MFQNRFLVLLILHGMLKLYVKSYVPAVAHIQLLDAQNMAGTFVAYQYLNPSHFILSFTIFFIFFHLVRFFNNHNSSLCFFSRVKCHSKLKYLNVSWLRYRACFVSLGIINKKTIQTSFSGQLKRKSGSVSTAYAPFTIVG